MDFELNKVGFLRVIMSSLVSVHYVKERECDMSSKSSWSKSSLFMRNYCTKPRERFLTTNLYFRGGFASQRERMQTI